MRLTFLPTFFPFYKTFIHHISYTFVSPPSHGTLFSRFLPNTPSLSLSSSLLQIFSVPYLPRDISHPYFILHKMRFPTRGTLKDSQSSITEIWKIMMTKWNEQKYWEVKLVRVLGEGWMGEGWRGEEWRGEGWRWWWWSCVLVGHRQ